jgi:hypothetical protein
MRLLTASSTSTSPSASAKTQIGTPQARWRESTQSGRSSIMPRRRFWPGLGTKAGVVDALERTAAQRGAVV